MSDIAQFYHLFQGMVEYERQRDSAKAALKDIYDELVKICPHPEAVDWQTTTGQGVFRQCKVCGVVDRASEGGTPGDEYNYGYPGHPSRSFWANTNVETVSEKEWWTYSKDHEWVVFGDRLRSRFE